MTNAEQFRELVEEFTAKEEEILSLKQQDYAPEDEDRLQNFREVAGFTGLDMSEVALIYFLKHVQSIKNAVMSGDYDWEYECEGGEGLKQRVVDARNYLLLIAACIEEDAWSYIREREHCNHD